MHGEKPIFEGGQENIEVIDQEIESLIEALDKYNYNNLPEEVQDEWYDVEMEGKVGKDRSAAKAHLEEFIKKLEELSKK